jgi:hypothetical protein
LENEHFKILFNILKDGNWYGNKVCHDVKINVFDEELENVEMIIQSEKVNELYFVDLGNEIDMLCILYKFIIFNEKNVENNEWKTVVKGN